MSTTRVSDYVADFFKKQGVDLVFVLTGSGNIRLIESFKQSGIRIVSPHHEQAGVLSALAYMRITRKPAVMVVTGGPGAINTVSSLADAYLDSLPLFIVAGQENSKYVSPRNQMRGKGVQGLDMLNITQTITKFSHCVLEPADIKWVLRKAFSDANSGRPGPVWIEIPQDIQWAQVSEELLTDYESPSSEPLDLSLEVKKVVSLIKQSSRPLFWIGNGVRLSGAEKKLLLLLDILGIPSLVSWQAADLIPDDHPLFVGRAGTYGQRFANLALQNCDLLITLGTRLALPQRGYNDSEFARAAKKIIVEIDPVEIEKFDFEIDLPILADVSIFIDALLNELKISWSTSLEWIDWKSKIKIWQNKYPMAIPPTNEFSAGINSYWFIERLSHILDEDTIIVTDMGTSLTCTHAAIKLKNGQRILTSTGLGEMGYGLPSAIGAAMGGGGRKVILIVGEGSLMMNLQELQTLKSQNLDVKILILNNRGYLTIKHTHNALFNSDGKATACDSDSGITFPSFAKLAEVFGFEYSKITSPENLDSWLRDIVESNSTFIGEIEMPDFQELVPKSAIKIRKDGTVYSSPLEDMYPFLSQNELQSEMLIPLLEEK